MNHQQMQGLDNSQNMFNPQQLQQQQQQQLLPLDFRSNIPQQPGSWPHLSIAPARRRHFYPNIARSRAVARSAFRKFRKNSPRICLKIFSLRLFCFIVCLISFFSFHLIEFANCCFLLRFHFI